VKRYILASAAARDLVEIWRCVKKESSQNTAERVETIIREKVALLAGEQRVSLKLGQKSPRPCFSRRSRAAFFERLL
jgi:plasmid stabilization system protein ParE